MAVELIAGEIKEGESKDAVIAFNDYARMGLGRSLAKLCERYQSATETPPTKRLNTLKRWSTDFGWQERVEAYEKVIDVEKTARADVRRKAIMDAGLALDYERVNELNEIYEKLKFEFIKSGLWYTDTKLSSTGVAVDVDVFNKPLIDSLRATLDDLAKETGGRKQKVDMEHGGKVKVEDDSRLSEDDRVARIVALLDAARARGDRSTPSE